MLVLTPTRELASQILATRGRVLPATLTPVTLCARLKEDRCVRGESDSPKAHGAVSEVYLEPRRCRPPAEVLKVIAEADLIVLGPGSLYTSVIPNLLVEGVAEAVRSCPAPKVYVCNVMTQPGETDGYSVSDHMRQLRHHIGDAFNVVLANDNFEPDDPSSLNSEWVRLPAPDEPLDYKLHTGDLLEPANPWRHDPQKLTRRHIELYEELRPRS